MFNISSEAHSISAGIAFKFDEILKRLISLLGPSNHYQIFKHDVHLFTKGHIYMVRLF
jgi:hypothetical protein